jgi:hypothetical protein
MMDDQRAIEASKPNDQRVYIGGEIELHYLSKSGFRVCTFDRFEDYAQDEKAIYDNFSRFKGRGSLALSRRQPEREASLAQTRAGLC